MILDGNYFANRLDSGDHIVSVLFRCHEKIEGEWVSSFFVRIVTKWQTQSTIIHYVPQGLIELVEERRVKKTCYGFIVEDEGVGV